MADVFVENEKILCSVDVFMKATPDWFERSSIKSSLWKKVQDVAKIFIQEGLRGLWSAIRTYLSYHLKDKWGFVYLEFCLNEPEKFFTIQEPINVRIATPADLTRIETELFPYMLDALYYDKRYFNLLGQPGVKCFLAECRGRLVHYSWVFLDASLSPIVEVPFDRSQLRAKDAYVGPIFTSPDYRGFVYLQVLSAILRFLRDEVSCERALVLVQGKNPSAVSFYKRMGFKVIKDAQPRNLFSYVEKKAKWLVRRRLKRIREYLAFSS